MEGPQGPIPAPKLPAYADRMPRRQSTLALPGFFDHQLLAVGRVVLVVDECRQVPCSRATSANWLPGLTTTCALPAPGRSLARSQQPPESTWPILGIIPYS